MCRRTGCPRSRARGLLLRGRERTREQREEAERDRGMEPHAAHYAPAGYLDRAAHSSKPSPDGTMRFRRSADDHERSVGRGAALQFHRRRAGGTGPSQTVPAAARRPRRRAARGRRPPSAFGTYSSAASFSPRRPAARPRERRRRQRQRARNRGTNDNDTTGAADVLQANASRAPVPRSAASCSATRRRRTR